jgi:HK97 family phage major capsid protein
MTREERQARIADLQRWFDEQNAEFRDESFPADVQEQWDANQRELREHEETVAQLERRDAEIRRQAERQEHRESGASVPQGRPASPQLISRMGEREVYDLSSVRFNPLDPARGSMELRDRALRAVEIAHFAHPDADQDHARSHVTKLLRRSMEEDDIEIGPLARRILTTGNPAYKRAFAKLVGSAMRGVPGFANLSVEEQRSVDAVRAMSVGTGSSGGFAVPYTLDPTVVPTSNLSVNPFRAICRTEQITGLQWNGVTSAGVTAGYAAEATEASDNSPTLVQPTMNVVRAQCFVPVSIELTQDWGALQSELANLIQDAKDDLEASKFTTGTGTNEPTGLITGATSTVTGTGGAATFVVGDLYAVEQALGPRFRPRAQWIANRFAYNKVRQFDTAGGASLWMYLNQGVNSQVPRGGNTGAELIGYPANENSAMAAALTTGSKIAVLGDPRYYLIVDRIGMDIEVIPHLFGATNRFPTGQRGFYAFWRNNANVLSANAFRVLVTA